MVTPTRARSWKRRIQPRCACTPPRQCSTPLVVLCRHGAAEVLDTTRRWMTSIGLALNETKTRVCNARCESFDFLGYTFGPMHSPRTGGRYNGARPSKKAMASIRDKIRRRLRPGNQAPWVEVACALNRTVRGWANYFSYGRCGRRGTGWSAM